MSVKMYMLWLEAGSSIVLFPFTPGLYSLPFYCKSQTSACFQLCLLHLILSSWWSTSLCFFMHGAPYLHFKTLCSLHKISEARLRKDQQLLLNPYEEQRRIQFLFYFSLPWCSAAADKTQHHGTLLSWSSVAPIRQLLLLKLSEQ